LNKRKRLELAAKCRLFSFLGSLMIMDILKSKNAYAKKTAPFMRREEKICILHTISLFLIERKTTKKGRGD